MRWVESSVGLDYCVGSKIMSRNLSPCQVISKHNLFCFEKIIGLRINAIRYGDNSREPHSSKKCFGSHG